MANASIAEKLLPTIRRDLLSGELKRGEKLTEKSLCEKYMVSRTPIREILRVLSSEGLIELVPYQGATVRGFTREDMADIFRVRELIESQAGAWAIERMDDDEADKIEQNFETQEYYASRMEFNKFTDLNREFHKMMFYYCHSRLVNDFEHVYHTYFRFTESVSQTGINVISAMLEEHRCIMEALRARDPKAGIAAIGAHMRNCRARAMQSLAAGDLA
jgi:DNA-binding GntR family transcriptional regulator